MATHKGRLSLSILSSLLAAGALSAAPLERSQERIQARATQHLQALRVEAGLNADHDFRPMHSLKDERGMTTTRFQSYFKGLRLLGRQVLVHTDAQERPVARLEASELPTVLINTQPSLAESEALATVRSHVNPKGEFQKAPSLELAILPLEHEFVRPEVAGKALHELNALDVASETTGYRLVYVVQTLLENEADGIRHEQHLVDAHTGALLRSYSIDKTDRAVGTGRSTYYGTVNLETNRQANGTYLLQDTTRGNAGGNLTVNLNHTLEGAESNYVDADNAWGDGLNFTYGQTDTTSAHGQTPAVDAHYGLGRTWDFYRTVLARNGIDTFGTHTRNRVHGYWTPDGTTVKKSDNAYWSSSCFCMTYADGGTYKIFTALDVIAHELTHGVFGYHAGDTTTTDVSGQYYYGEMGGLNEADSDIMGKMVEFWTKGAGAAGTVIPNTGGSWEIGKDTGTTLRYMWKQSKDGYSFDAWQAGLNDPNNAANDPHATSGPINRMFYFLSNGASSSSTSEMYSSYLPAGMTGIGNDKAGRIWYQYITHYMRPTDKYADARSGCLKAALDLGYGAASAEYAAIGKAYTAINVGGSISLTQNEVESNNTMSTANAVAASGTTVMGAISTTSDTDYFKVQLGAGRTLSATLTPPAGSDFDLVVYNSNGVQIGSSNKSGTTPDVVTVTNTGTSTFTRYIQVVYYSGASAANKYSLKLTF